MSAIGFDSCFYDRLDKFSRSLNRVLLSDQSVPFAADEDWKQVLELVETLAAQRTSSIAASSVAASISGNIGEREFWPEVANALIARKLSSKAVRKLNELAWSLDEERAAVLARMRNA
jgi:hypothetical protein